MRTPTNSTAHKKASFLPGNENTREKVIKEIDGN